MKRIYTNQGLALRMNLSSAVVIGAFLLGLWEFWSALGAGVGAQSNGLLFALFFVGGAVYAARQLLTTYVDMVISLDVDPATGASTIAVWRPFVSKRIDGPIGRLTNWRPYGKQIRRNVRTPVLLADHPDYPRPLEFEIGSGIVVRDDFRALAPEAAAAFPISPTPS